MFNNQRLMINSSHFYNKSDKKLA